MPSTPRAILLFALLAGPAVAGDESPFAGPFVPAPSDANSVAVGDLNLDGLPDLCISQGDGQLAVRLGLGNGAFAEPWLLPVAGVDNELGWVELADLNSDGRLDALVTEVVYTGSPGTLHAFLGAGDGTFAPGGSWPTPFHVNELKVTDLQPDGAPDVLLTSQSAQVTRVLLGDDHGGLVASGDLPSTSWETDVADVNGDGAPDVVGGGPWSTVLIHRGDGAGGFLPHAVIVSAGVEPMWVHAGDLDGDDHPDLLVGDTYGLRVLNGDDHVGFTLGQQFDDLPGSLSLADLDEDGDLDAVVRVTTLAVIGLNDGAGLLGFEQRYWGCEYAHQLVVADASGDGDIDLLFAPSNSDATFGSQMPLLRGRGNGTFVGNLLPMDWRPFNLALGDLDEDGVADAACEDLNAGKLHVLLGQGQGDFADAGTLSTAIPAGQLQTADFDADDHLDVLHVSYDLVLHRGVGDGALLPTQTLSLNHFSAVRQADLQADGDIDLVGLVDSSGQVRTLLNDGSAHFTESAAFTPSGSGNALCLADLGSDGWPDVVVALSQYSPQAGLALRAGLPDGGFGAATSLALKGGLSDAEAADIDSDGDLDIAGLRGTNNDLLWFKNDGLGNLQSAGPGTQTAAGTWADLQLLDATRDGVIDAVVEHQVSSTGSFEHVLTLAGLGGGLFAPPTQTTLNWSIFMTPGDVDGDGALDLLSAYDEITVLLNRDGPWDDLGHALAGAHGKPRQLGSGTAQPGTTVTVAMHDAVRLSPAVQFVGFGEGNVPFKGGVLVPTPDFVNHALQTDAQGELVVDFKWPAGFLPGTSLVLQTWIRDNAAPALWSASNALRVTTP